MYFNTIDDLRNGFPGSVPTTGDYIVGGYFSEGDGGGGTFVWVPISTSSLLPDDHGISIRTKSSSPGYFQGYFKRIYSGPINVRWFGAIVGQVDPNPPTDPFTGLPLAQPIADVTVYVHRARDSKEFADNGSLYFPKGVYPGAFEFTSIYNTPTYIRNEINIIGDGQGSVLTSNGATGYWVVLPDGTPNGPYNYPVLRLGYRDPHWRWAKVNNLKIDGSFNGAGKFAWGVTFESQGTAHDEQSAGRWIFEQVFFVNCDRGVFKFAGNIGTHYIDCTWESNTYGVYANSYYPAHNPVWGKQHSRCDRFTFGHFAGHTEACIRYENGNALSGQIIIDGTVLEQNPGWAIKILGQGDGRVLQNAVCLRNVWVELNEAGDFEFIGVRSVRIDDSKFGKIVLQESSVNLFNCRHDGGFSPGGDWDQNFIVDSTSSLVAYEHRYNQYPNSNIFVNSISYDGAREVQNMDWEPTSVWGPLRVVTSTKENIIVSEQFDNVVETWDVYPTNNFFTNSYLSQARVLGTGSNRLAITGDFHIWSKNVIGHLPAPGYYVWSIHTYLDYETDLTPQNFFGEIISDDTHHRFGYVYFKKGQWACSYGMKYIETGGLNMRLAFRGLNNPSVSFCFTDYQIVRFDDLAGANAFVNSKEFAIPTAD